MCFSLILGYRSSYTTRQAEDYGGSQGRPCPAIPSVPSHCHFLFPRKWHYKCQINCPAAHKLDAFINLRALSGIFKVEMWFNYQFGHLLYMEWDTDCKKTWLGFLAHFANHINSHIPPIIWLAVSTDLVAWPVRETSQIT